MKSFAHIIQLERVCAGETQKEFSDRLCIDQGLLSRIENGTAVPRFLTGIRMCQVIGIDINKIETRKE